MLRMTTLGEIVKKFALPIILMTIWTASWATQTEEAAALASISRESSRVVSKGTEDRFTGDVRVTSLFAGISPARATGGQVVFAAGARTAWHSHPLGQTLIVTAGTGRVQFRGGPFRRSKRVTSSPFRPA